MIMAILFISFIIVVNIGLVELFLGAVRKVFKTNWFFDIVRPRGLAVWRYLGKVKVASSNAVTDVRYFPSSRLGKSRRGLFFFFFDIKCQSQITHHRSNQVADACELLPATTGGTRNQATT